MTALDTPETVSGRPRWRPGPRTRKTIIVVHVVSSVALLGEVWGLVVLNLAATLTDDLALGNAAYRLMTLLVFSGGIPLTFTALCSGIVLGLGSRWGLVRYYWVFAKFLLLLAVLFFGMLLFQPGAMADATASGPPSSGRQWEQVSVVSAQLVMLVTATALSVFKPRRRIDWRRVTRRAGA